MMLYQNGKVLFVFFSLSLSLSLSLVVLRRYLAQKKLKALKAEEEDKKYKRGMYVCGLYGIAQTKCKPSVKTGRHKIALRGDSSN